MENAQSPFLLGSKVGSYQTGIFWGELKASGTFFDSDHHLGLIFFLTLNTIYHNKIQHNQSVELTR